MPMYNYRCQECETVFEVRASIQAKEAGLHPVCLECRSQQVQQIITAGLMLHGGKEINLSPACGCGANSKGRCCS